MNSQLLSGTGLASSAAGAALAGVSWLAAAAGVAAIPFLAVGLLLALDEVRARGRRVAGVSSLLSARH